MIYECLYSYLVNILKKGMNSTVIKKTEFKLVVIWRWMGSTRLFLPKIYYMSSAP